jgi:hypothetical protein
VPIPVVSPYLAGRHPLAGHEVDDVTVIQSAKPSGLAREILATHLLTGATVRVCEDEVLLLPDSLRPDYTGLTREDFILVGGY